MGYYKSSFMSTTSKGFMFIKVYDFVQILLNIAGAQRGLYSIYNKNLF